MLIPVREVPVRERVLAPLAHWGGGGGVALRFGDPCARAALCHLCSCTGHAPCANGHVPVRARVRFTFGDQHIYVVVELSYKEYCRVLAR